MADIQTWLKLDTETRRALLRRFYEQPEKPTAHEFLHILRAPKGLGVYASMGPNYQFAIFGRDSLEVADDLLETEKALATEIILLLAHLQGVETNVVTEEEPGKIHHDIER